MEGNAVRDFETRQLQDEHKLLDHEGFFGADPSLGHRYSSDDRWEHAAVLALVPDITAK